MLRLLPVVLAASSTFVLAVPHNHFKRDLIYDGSTVNGKSYDYIICGGGLGGSVLASRLTEDSTTSVLLVEAGYDEEGRAGVTDASQYQSTFGTWLDWQYQTVAQSSADDKAQTIRAGRALGGSTTINGMAFTKPHDFQIDALESLGNTGLNWASLQQYMLKAETGNPPSSSQASDGVTYDPSCHGTTGPVEIEYDPSGMPATIEKDFNSTALSLGLSYAYDLTCGNPADIAPVMNTRLGSVRSDAYRSYLYQKSRPNLTILAGATCGKVNLSTGSGTPKATGVEYRDEKSNTYNANANYEVILAAGALATPAILQYSGIGPSDVLSAAGITQIVDNAAVGKNLLDQTTTTSTFSFQGTRGAGQGILFPTFANLFTGDDLNTANALLTDDKLAQYAQDAVNAGTTASQSGLLATLKIQRDWILNKGAAISESFDYTYDSTLGYDSWYLLPFARGSVKVNNNDPYSKSISVDPKYFSNEFDSLAQGATVKFTRTTSYTAPMSSHVTGESAPGSSVASDASLTDYVNWSKTNYRSNWHPIGTVQMASQDLGGGLDSSYKVYGTTGLRVVDASVLPFQVSSHLMSVLYGLSERAADLIKADKPNTPTSSSAAPSSTSSAIASSTTSVSASITSSVSSTVSSTSSSPSSSSTPTPSSVHINPNGNTAKCLDVQNGVIANGTPIQLYDCYPGSSNQGWVLSKGETKIKLASNTNFCIDAGAIGNNIGLKIWQCYDGLAAQNWYFTDDNRIAVNGQGQCMDLTSGSLDDGNIIQTYSCSTGNNNQVWTTS